MRTPLKFLILLLSVPLALGGAKFMFDPTSVVERAAVDPVGAAGLNTLRGAVGGLLLGTAGTVWMGFVRRNGEWLLAAGLMMAVVTAGRVVGLGLDGVDPTAAKAAVVELVLVVVFVLGHRLKVAEPS